MTETLKEAERRFDELVETVERLLAMSADSMPQVQNDIQIIDHLLETISVD
jgi:hypothetical protein